VTDRGSNVLLAEMTSRSQTLEMIVHDVVDSLATHGFRRVVLLATHGGSEPPLQEGGAVSRRDGVRVVVPGLRVAVEALLEVARARGVPPGGAGRQRASSRPP
jgi:creatinine amidohydrolase/Fe(II)-dependent formamide hydrolase-like protein